MPQVEQLTDAQISMAYAHFEHGELAPQGVIMKGSFTQTMGRVWDSELGEFVIL